jgi:molybdenum cofactor cytidylyltransferase
MRENAQDYSIIILAAGSSRRLGTPKQLLPFGNKKLIQHIVETALKVTPRATIVTGAHKEEVEAVLQDYPVPTVFNQQHAEGMASSIRAGINSALEHFHGMGYALFLVCDQPFITSDLLQQLLEQRYQTEHIIVASAYSDTIGVPAVFHKHYFPDLLSLKGDTGARKIMQQYAASVVAVPFPMGYLDIDTAEDYELMKQKSK